MRLIKRLLVNDRPLALASDYVRLRLSRVGEGVFEVLEAPPRAARMLVELYVSVGGSEEYLLLTGTLTEQRELAPGRLRLAVQELSTVLNVPVTLNLMQCTVRQVIAKVEDATGLRFLLPAGATYLDERRVRFNFYGPALDALEAARVHWELPEMVWFQLPDGRMYWGHWASGPYTKAPIPIEPKLVSQLDNAQRTLVLPYIPALRPGMVVQTDFRFRIDGLTFSDETVRVSWTAV